MRHPGPQEVGQEINDERMQPDDAKWHKKEGNKEELFKQNTKQRKQAQRLTGMSRYKTKFNKCYIHLMQKKRRSLV